MINEKMQSMFNDYKPVNEATIEVTVKLHCDKLTSDLAEIIYQEMFRVAGVAGERLFEGIEAEDIRKYLATLGFLRRAQTVGLKDNVTKCYSALKHTAAVPTLWYQVLLGIGVAYDRDYSIKFIPGTSISDEDLIAPEDMLKISDLFWMLQDRGIRVVAGIPLQREGELDFMAMAHVDETTTSYRKSHPVYGFLASFFSSEEVSAALGTLVRIRYGYDSDYRTFLARIVSSCWEG